VIEVDDVDEEVLILMLKSKKIPDCGHQQRSATSS
jgi:hypothetical protein